MMVDKSQFKSYRRVCVNCGAAFTAKRPDSKVKYCADAACKEVAKAKQRANLALKADSKNLIQNQPEKKQNLARKKASETLRRTNNAKKRDVVYQSELRERKRLRKVEAKKLHEEKRQTRIEATKKRKSDTKQFERELEADCVSFKSRSGLGVKQYVNRTPEGRRAQRNAGFETNRKLFAKLASNELPKMPPKTTYRKDPELMKDLPYRSLAEYTFATRFEASSLLDYFDILFVETEEGLPERWVPGITLFGTLTPKIPDFRICNRATDILLEIDGFKQGLSFLRRSLFRNRESDRRLAHFKRARKELLDCRINLWLRTEFFVSHAADCSERLFAFLMPEKALDPKIIAELTNVVKLQENPFDRALVLNEFFRQHTCDYQRELDEILREFLPDDYFKLTAFFEAMNRHFAHLDKHPTMRLAADKISELYILVNFPDRFDLDEADSDLFQGFAQDYNLRPLLSDSACFAKYIYDEVRGAALDAKLSKFIDRKYPELKERSRRGKETALAKLQEHRRLFGGEPSAHERQLIRILGIKESEARFAPLCS